MGMGMRREWTGLTSKSLEKPHPSVSRWGRKNFSHEVWRYQSSDYRETRKRRGAKTGGSNQWLLNDGNASVTVMPLLRHSGGQVSTQHVTVQLHVQFVPCQRDRSYVTGRQKHTQEHRTEPPYSHLIIIPLLLEALSMFLVVSLSPACTWTNCCF